MKHNFISKIKTLSLLAAALLSFACQQQEGGMGYKKSLDEENVTISIGSIQTYGTDPAPVQRTVYSSTTANDLTEIKLYGAKEGDQTQLYSWANYEALSNSNIRVQKGTWNFTLTAKASEISYSGSLSSVVISDTPVNLPFNLSVTEINAALAQGTGSLKYELSFPASLEVNAIKANVSLYNSASSTYTAINEFQNESVAITTKTSDPSKKCILYTKANLASGLYKVSFDIYNDSGANYKVRVESESFYVSNNKESSGEKEFNTVSNCFTLNYETGIGSFAQDYQAPAKYTRFSPQTLPAAENLTVTGAAFNGWYDNSEYSGSAITSTQGLSGNKTLYAKWDYSTYSLNYVLDGGSIPQGAVTPATHTYMSTTILPRPVRKNYFFRGWYSNSDFSGNRIAQIDPKEISSDTTLYAKWEEVSRVHLIYAYELSSLVNDHPATDTFTHVCMSFVSNIRTGSGEETATTDIRYRKRSRSETQAQVESFRQNYPNTRLLMSFAGGDDGSHSCTYVLTHDDANHTKRTTVINNIIDFVEEFDLDGVDLDWEYFDDYDINNPIYCDFVKELRIALDENFTDYKLLTIASEKSSKFYSPSNAAEKKAMELMFKTFDFVSIMTYDIGSSQRGAYTESSGTYTMSDKKVPHISFNGRHKDHKLANTSKNSGPGTLDIVEDYIELLGEDKVVAGLPYYGHAYYILESDAEVPVSVFNNIKDSYSDYGTGYVATVDTIQEGMETLHPVQGTTFTTAQWPVPKAAAGTTDHYKNFKERMNAAPGGYTSGLYADQDNCVAYTYYKAGFTYTYNDHTYDVYELDVYDNQNSLANKVSCYLGEKHILGVMAWVYDSDKNHELQTAIKNAVDEHSIYNPQNYTYTQSLGPAKALCVGSDHTQTANEGKIASGGRFQFNLTGMSTTATDVYTFKFKLTDTSKVTSVTMRGNGGDGEDKYYNYATLSSFTQGTGEWQGWYIADCTASKSNSKFGITFNCSTADPIDVNTLVYIADVTKNGNPVSITTVGAESYSNITPVTSYIKLSNLQ